VNDDKLWHPHRLLTTPTDELTTILQLFVRQICHIAMPEPNISTCQVVELLWTRPSVVLYNMHVAGVRAVEFGTYGACDAWRKLAAMCWTAGSLVAGSVKQVMHIFCVGCVGYELEDPWDTLQCPKTVEDWLPSTVNVCTCSETRMQLTCRPRTKRIQKRDGTTAVLYVKCRTEAQQNQCCELLPSVEWTISS